VSPERVSPSQVLRPGRINSGTLKEHWASQTHLARVGLSGLEPLTSALSGEFMGVAQPPVTRRGRPGRSGLIHGAVGLLSSRTTSRQPIVTIERTVSVHPLSRSSHRRPATIDAPRKPPARARYLVGNSGERRETRPQLRPAVDLFIPKHGRTVVEVEN
jgi:hypothetical protein